MDKFQIKAVFDQFPFLSNVVTGEWYGKPDDWCARHNCTETDCHSHPTYIELDKVEEAFVKRVSPEFLGTRPVYSGATGASVGIEDSTRIFFLDQDGNMLLEVEQSVSVTHNEAHTDNEHKDNETIGEAILRLEDPSKMVYAVQLETGYEVRDYHSVGGYRVTVYQPPKGFTLKGWVEEQMMRAKAIVEATVAEIDAEYQQSV